MAGEAVAGAARDQAQGGRSVDEGAGDFVHGAVTTDGDHRIAATSDSGGCQLGSVTSTLSSSHRGIETVVGDKRGEGGEEFSAIARWSGVRVVDEAVFQAG